MKAKTLTVISVVLLAFVASQTSTIAHSGLVTILDVQAPEKVYDNQPFSVHVALHTSDWGKKIRITLRYLDAELGSAESLPLLDPRGSFVNLTISDVRLRTMRDPYKLTLDAYWVPLVGEWSLEDSRTLVIKSVSIHFVTELEPKTVQSNTSFNLTFRITNDGTDIAYALEAELTQLGGFGAEGPMKIALGDIGPGETRSAVIRLSSGILNFNEGPRKIILTLRFSDWTGSPHSQSVEDSLLLRLSPAHLSYLLAVIGFPLLVFLVGVVLLLLHKVRKVRAGPLEVIR